MNPPGLLAGILTIETQTTVQTTDRQIDVTVKITNNGNESARNTQITMIALNEKMQGAVRPELRPGESDVNAFTRVLPDITGGRYPLSIRVDFHDVNLYPFSALSASTFFVGKDVNSDIAVTGDSISLDKSGVLNFHIKNLGADPLNISANLFLPAEFSATEIKKFFQIEARSEKSLAFDVSNFSARESTYPLFCFFEYDNNNSHYTTIANVSITVKPPEGWFRSLRWLWGCIIVMLILLVCGISILQKKAGSKHR